MNDNRTSKLAAIMFTDIVGYSRMMEENENATMEVLEQHNAILFPLIESYEGRIVDTIGDGLLVVFESAYLAAKCALNIQKSIQDYNSQTTADHHFYLRIGLHIGDIWYGDERIYGNGVNITSRILPLSLPGGVCLSADAYGQVVNKLDIETKDLGEQQLKNINRPIRVYRMITGCESDTTVPADPEKGSDVRELIMKEKEKARQKAGGNFEHRLESRIYGFVEGIMDKALDKWDQLPAEKKEAAARELRKASDGGIELHSGESDGRRFELTIGNSDNDEEDEPETLLGVGVVASLGFGGALLYWQAMWLIFPMILIGLIPLGIGTSKLISRILSGRRRRRLSGDAESLIIAAAAKRGGALTVMQLAAEAGISLDAAQKELDAMASKGYIGQEVDERGFVVYHFPELKPE